MIDTLFSNIDSTKIKESLNLSGVYTIEDFFPNDLLTIFQKEVIAQINNVKSSSANAKYSLKYDDIKNHSISNWTNSEDFISFINTLIEDIVPHKISKDDIKLGYSILKEKGNNVPYHFDSLNILNLIVPIILPDPSKKDENHVDLYIVPNILPFNENLFTKIKSKIIQKLVSILAKKPLKYKEGAIHIFYGRRTLHGVKPIKIDGLRVILSVNIRFK